MRASSHNEEVMVEDREGMEEKETELIETEEGETEEMGSFETELAEMNDKYLRLYADFDNYKKRTQKDKEELVRYGNESLLYELLTVFDNLDMALQHSTNSSITEGIVKGVEITLRELHRVAEKFGLTPISALNKPFDPSLHHAIAQVERDDVGDKTVVEEFRKGYMLGDKVLRPSLVAVSKKAIKEPEAESDTSDTEIEFKED